MKDRIKKFMQEHDDEIDAALLLGCGVGALFCASVALYKIYEVEGLKITGVEVFAYEDGTKMAIAHLANGQGRVFSNRTT